MVASSAGAARNRKIVPEVQRIWVHCEDEDETRDILAFSRESFRPIFLPEIVDPKTERNWLLWLQSRLTMLPLAYCNGDWLEFWSDCEVLLAASLACSRVAPTKRPSLFGVGLDKENYRQLQEMRRPALLVTDREKLCHATGDFTFMQTLAEAANIRREDLLPVVLASDFRLLCGRLVQDPPLSVFESFLGHDARLNLISDSRVSPSGSTPTSVTLPYGVFLQRYRPACDAGGGGGDGRQLPIFGARCLALFANGYCAYSAVSEDGVRSVEASGVWEVINGHVVVGGSTGQAVVWHLSLSHTGASLLDGVAYDEAVHVPLEDLATVFEPPIHLADCVARPGTEDHLRMLLREKSWCHDEGPWTAEGNDRTPEASHTPVGDLAATFSKTWASDPAAPADAEHTTVAGAPVSPSSMRTSEHALMSLAKTLSNSQLLRDETAWERRDSTASQQTLLTPAQVQDEPAPRLLGLERGITVAASNGFGALAGLPQTPGHWTPMETRDGGTRNVEGPASLYSAMQQLTQFAAALSGQDRGAAQTFPTCPLRPGKYAHDSTQPGSGACRRLEMTLHANGRCTYRERANKDTIKSDRNSTWGVQDGKLVLGSARAHEYAFLLREVRGTRVVERRVARIEIPVEVVLRTCTFEQFKQQSHPFLTYTPKDVAQRVFGVIDPQSPVLVGMKCQPDRIPYHAFERELRESGIPCDDLISDFKFIDRDEDGQLSVADMRLIDSYGGAAVATEVIHELRKALLHRFDDLESAFDAICAGRSQRQITVQEFESFLGEVANEPAPEPSVGKHARGSEELKTWYAKTTPEDRAAVFASINPNNGQTIDLTDFMSLSLHTAILAIRRLQHFQSWIFERFGRSKQVFEQVFNALDQDRAQALTRSAFVVGAEAIGYPCSRKATKSMFSMLDRNLDGNVSKLEFQWLRQFNGDQLILSLEALKRLARSKFGGITECFQKLLKREQKIQGTPFLPSTVCYEAFKAMLGPGLGRMVPNPDMKELFLFLDEAYKKHANGCLTLAEWSLLRGFDSRALTGSPARLRRILNERYGSLDQAFEQMHTAWLKRALVKGLGETALVGLARSLHNGLRGGGGNVAGPKSSQGRRPASAGHGANCAGRAKMAAAGDQSQWSPMVGNVVACGTPVASLRRCASASAIRGGRSAAASAGPKRRCGSAAAFPRASIEADAGAQLFAAMPRAETVMRTGRGRSRARTS